MWEVGGVALCSVLYVPLFIRYDWCAQAIGRAHARVTEIWLCSTSMAWCARQVCIDYERRSDPRLVRPCPARRVDVAQGEIGGIDSVGRASVPRQQSQRASTGGGTSQISIVRGRSSNDKNENSRHCMLIAG